MVHVNAWHNAKGDRHKATSVSMFAPFSSGYYVGRLQVEPHGGDDALMHRSQIERVNEQLYARGAGVERIDYPLVMKLWNRHFAVHGDDGVPENTLFIPSWMTKEHSLNQLPGIREVLLAKPDVVQHVLEWSGDGTDLLGR